MFCPAEGVKLSGAPVFKGGKDYEWMWLWRISPVRLTATFIATLMQRRRECRRCKIPVTKRGRISQAKGQSA